MRILMLLIAGTLICSFTLAQTQLSESNSHQGDVYARRDLALERAALAQRDKIDAMLPPWVKQKLELVFDGFLKRLLRDKKPVNAAQIMEEELARQFVELSQKQIHILSFYVVTGVIKKVSLTDREAQAEKEKNKDKKDSISDISDMDMLMLQQMLEKENQLERMISNVMKAGFEGGQAAIQTLKAS